jgi:hypothetical protein
MVEANKSFAFPRSARILSADRNPIAPAAADQRDGEKSGASRRSASSLREEKIFI